MLIHPPIVYSVASPTQLSGVRWRRKENASNKAMHTELATVPDSLYQLTRANRVIASVIPFNIASTLQSTLKEKNVRLHYLILATLLSCLCIGCGEDPQTGNPAAPAPVAKENETPVASDTKSNPDVDSQKDSQTPPVTVANDGDPINGNELRDHRTDAKFEFPARFAAIQDEHFQLAKLEEAQKHLVLAISEQATFNEMPFPIHFRVVSKLKDDLYEIQNRTTGQNALLRTSKTEFKTTGLAMLIVQKEDSLSLPMENGFERTFDVFRETLDDYDTGESRYFEMRESIREHQRQFWSLTHDSNVVPANSMEDLAEMYGVTVEQLAILWNSFVLENWKRTYDSNRHKDREK